MSWPGWTSCMPGTSRPSIGREVRGRVGCRTCTSPAAQLAKTTLFASGNGADVRQTRRSAFGRPEVDPKGAVQGWRGTKTAAGQFFQLTRGRTMLDELKKDAALRMAKCVSTFRDQLKKLRTGRAHT